MTTHHQRQRTFLFLAVAAVLSLMIVTAALKYYQGMLFMATCVGLMAMLVACWYLWRKWPLEFVILCAESAMAAVLSGVAARRPELAVFAGAMNVFALVLLILPATRAFQAEQHRNRQSQCKEAT